MNQSGEPSPFMLGSIADPTNLKLSHDRYEVYVNGDFVGHKVLLTQSESIDDVAKYLKNNGYQGFSTNLDGDHYYIDVDGRGDNGANEADQIKNQLGVYLDIR